MGYRHTAALAVSMHVPLAVCLPALLLGLDPVWLLPAGALTFLLGCWLIADLWTSDSVEPERRPLWLAAVVVAGPLALPAYWWLHLRERVPARLS